MYTQKTALIVQMLGGGLWPGPLWPIYLLIYAIFWKTWVVELVGSTAIAS